MRLFCKNGIASLLLLSGCATGFDRGAIRERLAGERVEVNDAAIELALRLRPQVRFPIRVAVVLNESLEWRGQRDARAPEPRWRFTTRDGETIASWAESLRERGVVSELFVVSDLVKTGSGLREARLAAARCGADAVLYVQTISQVEGRLNPLSVLNLLFPNPPPRSPRGGSAFFVPASHRDALVVMKGALYDVGNEYLYLTVDAEGEAGVVRPTFRARDEDAIFPAREKALTDFGRELTKRIQSLRGG